MRFSKLGAYDSASLSIAYYFIKPNILHDEYYCTTGESLVFWFEIEGDFDIPSYIIQTDETLNLYNFAERIRREIEIKSFGYNMIVNSLLLEIITLLGRQYNLKTHNTNFLIENNFKVKDGQTNVIAPSLFVFILKKFLFSVNASMDFNTKPEKFYSHGY